MSLLTVLLPQATVPPSQSPPPVGPATPPWPASSPPLVSEESEMDRTSTEGSKKVCFKVCEEDQEDWSRHHELPGLLQVGAGLAWEVSWGLVWRHN